MSIKISPVDRSHGTSLYNYSIITAPQPSYQLSSGGGILVQGKRTSVDNPRVKTRKWWAAFEDVRGNTVLDVVDMTKASSAVEEMEFLKLKYMSGHNRVLPWILCKKLYVGLTSFPELDGPGLEMQTFPRSVALTSIQRSEFLTQAWNHPALLSGMPSLQARLHLAECNSGPNKIVVIMHATNKMRIGIVLSVVIALIALIGMLVGMRTRNVQTGAEVGSALLAIVALALAFLRSTKE